MFDLSGLAAAGGAFQQIGNDAVICKEPPGGRQ